MANPSRGEVELILGDKTYTMSATMNQACELEAALDMGLFGLAEMLSEPKGMKLITISQILHKGIRGGYDRQGKALDDAPTLAFIMEKIFSIGVLKLAQPAMSLVQAWLVDDETAVEAKTVAKKE